MLLNDFYKIKRKIQSESGWTYIIELNPTHPIYNGHFPNNPIVPGVCTLQIIRECSEDIMGYKMRMTQLSFCKFLAVVNPDENNLFSLNITLNKKAESSEYILQSEGTYMEQSFIKVKASLDEFKRL